MTTTPSGQPGMLLNLIANVRGVLYAASAPFIGYIFVFVYFSGFCTYFQVPVMFISFELAYVFIALGVVAFLLLGAYLLICGWSWSTNAIHMPAAVARRLGNLIGTLGILLIVLPGFVSLRLFAIWAGLSLVCVIAIVFGNFICPLLFAGREGPLRERLEESDSKKIKGDHPNTENGASRSGVGYTSFIRYLVVLIALLWAMFSIGRYVAQTKRTFSVIDTSPRMVVLYLSSDRAVIAPVDVDERKVYPCFQLVSLMEKNLAFAIREVGPLSVAELPTNARLNTHPEGQESATGDALLGQCTPFVVSTNEFPADSK